MVCSRFPRSRERENKTDSTVPQYDWQMGLPLSGRIKSLAPDRPLRRSQLFFDFVLSLSPFSTFYTQFVILIE